MDFFGHQEAARKRTTLLVFYFGVAVILVVASVYLAVAGVLLANQARINRAVGPEALWNPELFLVVSVCTLALIGLGSLYKTAQLRSGGEAVATMLGGRPVDPNTIDLDERVLLNVVEEMAIASGTPVPPVFVLEEKAINAFAAGWSPNDAVIGVTRGAVETLTRDELQGVIAHEFSHLLNGDMRTNIRLIGLLHGILLIALIGYGILRSLRGVRVSSSEDSKKGGGGGLILAMLCLGLAFLIIGGIGVFFGRLIQSAVSRQREFLADASAVQFTRNPSGIAGALRKIGGLIQGSRLQTARAVEASHLFFGNALRSGFLGLLSTHPPLAERIRRIEPTFDGTFPEVSPVLRTARDLYREETRGAREQHAASIRARHEGKTQAGAAVAAFAFEPDAAVATIGTLRPENVEYAAGLMSALPDRIAVAVHDPLGAVTTVYCLLLDDDVEIRGAQLQSIKDLAGLPVLREVERLAPAMAQLGLESRLPLVAMAVPALCKLSETQYQTFRKVVDQLVEADEEIDIFEYSLQRLLLRQLSPHLRPQRPQGARFQTWPPLLPSCTQLLSTLAHMGNRDEMAATQAFSNGAARLPLQARTLALIPRKSCGPMLLDKALDVLAEASPQIKKCIIEASACCVESDGQVTVGEAELLRVVAVSLDCPMPPLLATGAARNS